QWMFFLANAARFEASDLRRLLPSEEFSKAVAIMETIARTPEERQLYETRLKAERDHEWALRATRIEAHQEGREEGIGIGREEGREEGRQALIQQIARFETRLGGEVTPPDQLEAMDLPALQARLNDIFEWLSEK